MKKYIFKLCILTIVLSFSLNINSRASEIEVVVTEEQLEAMNAPTGDDADKLSYLTMDAEELIERFRENTKRVTSDVMYKKFDFTVMTGEGTFMADIFPNMNEEEYLALDKYEKFCIYFLAYRPYVESQRNWSRYDGSKGVTSFGEDVDAAYAEVTEWHRNNHELYGIFVNPYDDGSVKEAYEKEEISEEEEIQEIQEEIAEELGIEIKEGKYEKAWKDLLLSNIITIILIIAAGVVYIVLKRKHKQISND